VTTTTAPEVVRDCLVCGESFESVFPNKKLCGSEACAEERDRQVRRERQRRVKQPSQSPVEQVITDVARQRWWDDHHGGAVSLAVRVRAVAAAQQAGDEQALRGALIDLAALSCERASKLSAPKGGGGVLKPGGGSARQVEQIRASTEEVLAGLVAQVRQRQAANGNGHLDA
jgi:predicted nucleic acid-binding Zn ribbon protein